jgi:hypothetical protein
MSTVGAEGPPVTEGELAPVVIRWPAERLVAEQLASRGVPRLLLVDADSEPPLSVDPLEDWLRLPAEARDLEAKLAALRQRAEGSANASAPPVLDGNGRLLRGSKWVVLSPIEEQLTEVLVERFGEVVSDNQLLAQGWPDVAGSHTALRVQLMRLRRRVAALGLEIRTVRGRGYVLQFVP